MKHGEYDVKLMRISALYLTCDQVIYYLTTQFANSQDLRMTRGKEGSIRRRSYV